MTITFFSDVATIIYMHLTVDFNIEWLAGWGAGLAWTTPS
jgi:hypothetical protein